MAPFILLAAEISLVSAFSRASILNSFVDMLQVVRINYEPSAAHTKAREIFVSPDVVSIKTVGAFISRKLSVALFIVRALWF